MEGKQAIINKILSDASEKAAQITDNAKTKNDKIIADAKAWAKEYVLEESQKVKKECEELIEKRTVAANMDVNKLMLKGKREVIEKVFSEVLQKMCQMDKPEYLGYIEKLLIQHAEEGDSVMLSNKAPITESDIKSLSVFNQKNLVFAGTGDFESGIMLSNPVCDTNLTFASIIEDSKINYETAIAEKLFG